MRKKLLFGFLETYGRFFPLNKKWIWSRLSTFYARNVKMTFSGLFHILCIQGRSIWAIHLVRGYFAPTHTQTYIQQYNLDWYFPEQWKEANVTPVRKKNDKQIYSNYRPISLLPGFWADCFQTFIQFYWHSSMSFQAKIIILWIFNCFSRFFLL